jgi:hypothetical protein
MISARFTNDGGHFSYRYIWWPQHILSHHQYTNDDKLDVDLHHLRPARLHPGCTVDGSATGFNFLFKGYFSTLGMAALWPLRNLEDKSTGRWCVSRSRFTYDLGELYL